ncbi:MAG: NUDIX hydrolase [Solirubrobacterales bacterium]|nr:NUDIX hydrolase [Solirubrobacterales bacterium]
MSDLPPRAPGETLNDGPETVPREASTVIVLRGGNESLEVLLVQRNIESRFMGGAWVFPGGAVDKSDGIGEAALRAAAVREVTEEAGIELNSVESLVPFSRWITPREVKIRFDTWFYLAELPDGAVPSVDGHECVDLRWETPQSALEAHGRDELLLVFPTIRSLEQISQFDNAHALLEHARGTTVEPVEPRIEILGEIARVLLPGDPGYDSL